MGKRNRRKRKQRANSRRNKWDNAWPEFSRERENRQKAESRQQQKAGVSRQATEFTSKKKKKKKNKGPKYTFVRDPSIPDKLQQTWAIGRIVVGSRCKDGSTVYFSVDPTNK